MAVKSDGNKQKRGCMLSVRAREITPYTAGEQPRDRRYVKLNTNENPYAPSPQAAAAMSAVPAADLRLYPDPNSTLLVRAIAAAEGVDDRCVFVGNGSDEVLSLAFAALFDKDVKFCDVTYSFYPVFCAFSGLNHISVPLKEDFSADIDALCTGDCGGVVLANPNAPTGQEISLADIERIVQANRNVPVIVDEAYVDFSACGSAVPLCARYDNLLVVKTFSKSYALAGMRCGWAVGDPGLIDGLRRMRDSFNSYPVDRICQAVCAAAAADKAYYRGVTQKVRKTRGRTIDALRGMGAVCPDSGANFLLVTVPGGDGSAAYRYLRDCGVLVRYFDQPRLRDKLRVTIGTDDEMDVFLTAFADWMQKAEHSGT